jgi:hypothetical protein
METDQIREHAMLVSDFVKTAFLFASVLALAACGGGGGGGSRFFFDERFTSWNDIAPDTIVKIAGRGQESPYTYDVAAEKVTSLSGFSDVAANAFVTYDSSQEPMGLAIETSQSFVSWDENQEDEIGNLGAVGLHQIDAAISGDLTELALTANPYFLGWNYQTFGVWVTGSGTGFGRIGTLSVGSITPSAGVPNVGTPTYLGELGGAYVAPDGTDFVATADLQIDADFLTNALDFRSLNTRLTRDLQTFTPDSNLDLNGTLTCCGGSSGFAGPVSNQTGGLVGEAKGSFYGPNAEELGGNFLLTNGSNNLETYVGSFGAAR